MNNFKKPKKNRNKLTTLDGFIPSNGSLNDNDNDIRARFRQSYHPSDNQRPEPTQSIDETPQEDGLHTTNRDLQSVSFENQDVAYIASTIEEEPKNGLFRTNKVKKQRNWRRRFARGFAVSFLALVIAVGSLFTYGYIKTQQVFKGNGEGAAALQEGVDPSRLNGEGDGRINILLLGKGGPGHEAPDLTDTILLASIDPVQDEAALLSVPRDLYVEDANGFSTKINAIYSNAKQASLANIANEELAEEAGLRAIKQSVNQVLGVPIHYYTMINFTAFEEAINTVGGLTINVEEALIDYTIAHELGGDPVIAAQGLQTLDGERALYYARSRKGSARGDFDRTQRQREVIIALQNKILSTGTFSNPLKIVELLNTFGTNVRTDLNGIDEIKRLYDIGKDIDSSNIVSVELADDPVLVVTDLIGTQSVVVPVEGLYQYGDIHSFVRNNLRDAFLKQEDSRVVILNGTSVAGLATAKQNELQSYGYNVVLIDNAPTANYATTKLIDLTLGEDRYTENYLERRLGVSSTNLSEDGVPTNETADFVIILGNDEAIKTTQN